MPRQHERSYVVVKDTKGRVTWSLCDVATHVGEDLLAARLTLEEAIAMAHDLETSELANRPPITAARSGDPDLNP